MSTSQGVFDWVRLPEGRGRFSGGGRSWDEKHHFTFAIDVNGHEYFGEIERRFLPNDNDYNIEVVSFGYGSNTSVGMPMLDSCQKFSLAEVESVQALIVQLIEAGTRFPKRPSILMEYPDAHFMGEVVFQDGWVLVGERGVAP